MSETDIRKMIESLRPVADFKRAVGKTIDVLNTRIVDIIPMDSDDRQELEDLRELVDFWCEVQAHLNGEI